jgi:hypothetical protein
VANRLFNRLGHFLASLMISASSSPRFRPGIYGHERFYGDDDGYEGEPITSTRSEIAPPSQQLNQPRRNAA